MFKAVMQCDDALCCFRPLSLCNMYVWELMFNLLQLLVQDSGPLNPELLLYSPKCIWDGAHATVFSGRVLYCVKMGKKNDKRKKK